MCANVINPGPIEKLTLTFQCFRFIVGTSGAVFGACSLIKFGAKCQAGVAVICQGPRTAATCRVALATAALIHVLIVPRGTACLTHTVQNQVKEAAF